MSVCVDIGCTHIDNCTDEDKKECSVGDIALREDKGYQVFSNLMDAVFELCEELHDRIDNHEGLTDAEFVLLDAMDEYVDYELEQDESENEEQQTKNN